MRPTTPTIAAQIKAAIQQPMKPFRHRLALGRGRRGRNKYGNEPTVIDGYQFDSAIEARHYGALKLRLLAGEIHDLDVHRNWFLHVNGQRIGYYEADFTYLEKGQTVIDDTKGFLTPMYKWKKKHVFAEYGITIREIKATR